MKYFKEPAQLTKGEWQCCTVTMSGLILSLAQEDIIDQQGTEPKLSEGAALLAEIYGSTRSPPSFWVGL